MGKISLGLFLVLVSGAVLSFSTFYSDEEIIRFISKIPEDERHIVLRYAIIRGYELTEKKSSGLAIPVVYTHISFGMMKAIYEYYLKDRSIPDKVKYVSSLDIVCLPNGCIEIEDPGNHP